MSGLKQGTCGNGVSWMLDVKTGMMTISGSGAMEDYESPEEAPWHELCGLIKGVTVEEGVTKIGDYAFLGCAELSETSLPSTLEVMGVYCFSKCALREVVIPDRVRLICAKAFEANEDLERVTLPAAVRSIDMKAFNQNPKLKQVIYGGTKSRWDQIRISANAMGNQPILEAEILCAGENGRQKEEEVIQEVREVIPVLDEARGLLKQGGDGNFYVLALNLSMKGLTKKPGDCALLIFPDGQTMMIDSGVAESRERLIAALDRLELTSLDYFTLSHPHNDHVGNAMAVAEYIDERGGRIGTYFYTGYPLGDLEPSFAAYLQEHGTRMDNRLRDGDVRQIGEVKMEILGPSEEKMALAPTLTPEHLNRISLMQKFTYGDTSYLTCGDLYRIDEQEAVAAHGDRLRATVAKVNHHGVYTSNCEEWVEAVFPKVFLVTSDDIGATLFEERAARMGIGYYSCGLDGEVLIRLTKDGQVELETAYGKRFCK